MSEQTENPYQVLGVERTADERAIKKAYFALIRKHPPDSQPEEFKRVRQAYETLSDPVARRRYDAMDRDYLEYGDDAATALREAEEATKSGNDEEAQRKLRLLLGRSPDLHVARENLANSLVKTDALADALVELESLCKACPEEARYWAQRAFVQHRLDKPKDAEASMRKAHKLAPDNVGIHIELVDLLIGLREYEPAVREVDELIKKKKEEGEKAADLLLVLRLRKLDALYGGGSEKALKLLNRIVSEAKEAGDPELPKFVASRLAAVAAKLFARREYDKANALLGHASGLYPESAVLRPYPSKVTLDVSDLPPEGQRWLSELKPGPQRPTIARATWPAPIFYLIVGVAAAVVTLLILFHEPSPWTAESLAASALFLGASAFILATSARHIFRILKSPLRSFISVHPLYVLSVSASRIELYPLFNLGDVRAVHQHTNGAYTGTTATLMFHQAQLSLTLSGKAFAEGWLQFLLDSRRRALELMLGGYLEAEHGVELIPPALLSKTRREASYGETLKGYTRPALAALLGWMVLIPIRSCAATEEMFRRAVRVDSIASYAGYLERNPDGRRADDARAFIHAAFERAREALRAGLPQGVEPPKALFDALERLEASRVTTVPVVVDLSALSSPSPTIQGDTKVAGVLGGTTSTPSNRLRGEIAERLAKIAQIAGLSEVMSLKLADAPDPKAPVVLTIAAKTNETGEVYESRPAPVAPALRVDWDVTLSAPADGKELFRWSTQVEPPERLRMTRNEGEEPAQIGARAHVFVTRNAVEVFLARLTAELGLKSAADAASWARPFQPDDVKEVSPYAR